MSFVGKILVVVQLLMSILLMVFAGAVSSTHTNWRTETNKTKESLKKANTDMADLKTEFEKFKTEAQAEKNRVEGRAGEAEAQNVGLKQQVEQLNREKKDLTVSLATANELSQISGEEAKARRTESITLREINQKLLTSRDTEFRAKTKLEDDLQSLQLDYEAAQQKVKYLLGELALRNSTLESYGISTDPKDLVANVSSPPRVHGKVLDIKPARTKGMNELIEISLGSDDGLAKGHQLFVFRSGLGTGEKPKYLGKIKIVNTTPDRCVAMVIEEQRGGAIQKGDNVTTKF